ncbi:MAG: sulfur carrier protein ThiS [Kiritimatiellia bacterium]
MNVIVNGEGEEVREGLPISELLLARQVKMPDRVSVELNGEILDRAAFGSTALRAGDKVEFLYFMGGGGRVG